MKEVHLEAVAGVGYWFKCPGCSELIVADSDQVQGLVSMVCPTIGCTFHDTGTVSPLIPSTTPIKPEDAPTWEGYHG